MHDLCDKLYVDAYVQPGRKANEYKAFVDMVDCSNIPADVIVVADRGYENFNAFAHIEQKGWKYVIRVRICSH